jgi:hypothetical protein
MLGDIRSIFTQGAAHKSQAVLLQQQGNDAAPIGGIATATIDRT